MNSRSLSNEDSDAKLLYTQYIRQASFPAAFLIYRGSDLVSSSQSFHADGKWPSRSLLGSLLTSKRPFSSTQIKHDLESHLRASHTSPSDVIQRGHKRVKVERSDETLTADTALILGEYLIFGNMFVMTNAPIDFANRSAAKLSHNLTSRVCRLFSMELSFLFPDRLAYPEHPIDSYK